jgi:hypothetical protein
MKAVRERFGGSQQWWADYLGVSLGQVKMAETDKRNLPSAAYIKLTKLELLKVKEQAPLARPKKKVKASKQLTLQAGKLEQQAYRAAQLLETAQQRYTQAIAAINLTAQLLKANSTNEEEHKDQLLLETRQYEAGKAMDQYGLEAQAWLQWKIDCYNYGAARAREFAVTE